MIRLVVAGAAGRMGKTILKLASQDPAFRITGAIEHSDSPALGEDIGTLLGTENRGVRIYDNPEIVLKEADVLVDFTHPSATLAHVKGTVKSKTAYVLGTTGLTPRIMAALRNASRRIPIVQAPNMSIGVNLLFKIAEISGKVLDERYDVEIAEIHHRMKKDAPSGTALKLLDILAKTRRRNPKKDAVYGRHGETGARPKGKMGVFALRGGDVVGDHTLSFLGDGERVELVHRATSREAFANGALQAAKFVARRRSGLYTMFDVLGIK